jgi:CheY-like chemotaxis protein
MIVHAFSGRRLLQSFSWRGVAIFIAFAAGISAWTWSGALLKGHWSFEQHLDYFLSLFQRSLLNYFPAYVLVGLADGLPLDGARRRFALAAALFAGMLLAVQVRCGVSRDQMFYVYDGVTLPYCTTFPTWRTYIEFPAAWISPLAIGSIVTIFVFTRRRDSQLVAQLHRVHAGRAGIPAPAHRIRDRGDAVARGSRQAAGHVARRARALRGGACAGRGHARRAHRRPAPGGGAPAGRRSRRMNRVARPRAIIAEDEANLREELRETLADVWPELDVCAEANNGVEALRALDKHEPDVMFLDIQMPGLTGLDVARRASGRCHVVFVTAYDNYAVSAFEQGAVDYVMKPFSAARISQSVTRLRERLTSTPPDIEDLVEKIAGRLQGKHREYLRWVACVRRRRDPPRHHGRDRLLPLRQQVHRGRHGGEGSAHPHEHPRPVRAGGSRGLLADPPRHDRERDLHRGRHARLPWPHGAAPQTPRRDARRERLLQPPFPPDLIGSHSGICGFSARKNFAGISSRCRLSRHSIRPAITGR